jgi:lipopolysaccharide cholinephosphotransferase
VEEQVVEQIVVFGAGSFGRKLVDRLAGSAEQEVLFLVDNDASVHGTTWHGLEVRPPTSLDPQRVDAVWVASTWHEEIVHQLEDELGIAPELIRVVSPDVLEGAEPAHLTDLLHRFSDLCSTTGVSFWLDHSSLLGLVRSGDLFALRGGVDLAMRHDDVEALLEGLHDRWTSVPVEVSRVEDGGATELSARHVVQLSVGDASRGVLDIRPMLLDGGLGLLTWRVGPYVLGIDPRHYEGRELRTFDGRELPVPVDPEGYLTTLYGEWRTPVDGWTFADYCNIVRRLEYGGSARP